MNADRELATLTTDYDRFLLLGQLYCQKDRPDAALDAFRQCASLRPGSYTAHTGLGRIYLGQGRFAQAEASFANAHRIEPRCLRSRAMLLHCRLRQRKNDSVTMEIRNQIVAIMEDQFCAAGLLPEGAGTLAILNARGNVAFSDESVDAFFRTSGYAVLKKLIPSPYIELLRLLHVRYRHSETMRFQPNKMRYVKADEPISVLLQAEICERVSRLTGHEMAPTYTCSIHYVDGGHIRPHMDRAQNEISVSLSIDKTPTDAIWPLYVVKDGSEIACVLEIGDALIYRGTEVMHYRKPLPPGHTVTQLIVGFRRADLQHCNYI